MTEENPVLSAEKAEPTAEAEKTEEAKQDVPAKTGEEAAKAPEADDAAASEAAKLLAQRKQSARERVQQAVARQREAERQSAEKDKVIADLRAKLKEPDPAQYDDNAKYTADVINTEMTKRDLQALERDKQQADTTARQSIAEAWATRVDEFKTVTPDFEQIAYTVPISEATALLIAEMEEGPELAYQLGKNHAEARRIDRLPGHLKAVELGKIAARIATPPPPIKTTKAPEPIDTVSGRGSSAKTKPASEMSYQEWKAFREKGGKP